MKHSNEDILIELKAIIHKLFEIEPEDVTLESRFYEDLDLDSIDAVDLIVSLQEETGHKFKPEEFKAVRTVSDVIDIISTELNDQDSFKMRLLLKSILVVLVLLYPFLIFFGIKFLSLKYLGLLIILIFSLRLIVLKNSIDKLWLSINILGIVLVLLAVFINNITFMLLYPVFISSILFGVFTYSLFQEKSIITKIAIKLGKTDLPNFALTYTWYATLAWCVFFAINTFIALFTVVYGSIDVWSIYNGFISYILTGIFMASEIAVRFLVRRHFEKLP